MTEAKLRKCSCGVNFETSGKEHIFPAMPLSFRGWAKMFVRDAHTFERFENDTGLFA